MADISYDVLTYMVARYGSTEPLVVALNHEGQRVPRAAKVDLINRFGSNFTLGEAMRAYEAGRTAV